MDACMGISRGELLEWINTTLHMNLHKIEETASGAVACQIIDILYPDTIPLQRVNFAARDTYEYSKNYKILQAAFLKNNIQKNIDVERLIKGRPQDNLEFMQWLKQYYDQHKTDREYNAEERRSVSKRSRDKINASILHSPTLTSSPYTRTSSRASSPDHSLNSIPSLASKRVKTMSGSLPKTHMLSSSKISELESEIAELKKQLQEKEGIIQKQELEIKNVEAERDFYNSKLVAVEEVTLKSKDNNDITVTQIADDIKNILYAQCNAFSA